MHVAAVARNARDLDLVADALLQDHVKIHTFSRYYLGRHSRAGLIFGYGTADLPQIEQGVALLRKALRR
jgi:DNA-binding transcriptional MocR family regulator